MNETPPARKKRRKKEAASKKLSRGSLSPEQSQAQRERNSAYQKRSRASLSPDEARAKRKKNTTAKRKARASLSPDEARAKRQKNTEAKRKARDAMVSINTFLNHAAMPISSSIFSRKGDREHNDITSQEFQVAERHYQQMCRDAEMRYLAPNTGRTNKERKADTRRRRSNMTKMCDLYSDVNSEKFKATEDKHRKKCADAGVPYIAPDIDRDATIENKRDTTRRRAAMTRSCTQLNDIKDPAFEDEESRFRVTCSQCNVDYVPPTPVAGNASQELKVNTKSRRAAMSRQIDKEPPVQTFDELGIPNVEVNIDVPVKLAAKQLCNTMVGDRTHMGNVCLICDRSSIGDAFFDYISKAHVLRHRDRLSVESYELEHGSLHELVKEYYAVEGLEGLLLSPRAPRKGDGFVCCSTCRHGLRASRAESKNPPKYSIANNFATGALPEYLTIRLEDGTERTFEVTEESLTPEIRAAVAPVRPHAYVHSYSGGRHVRITGTHHFFDSSPSQLGNAVDHVRTAR